MSGALSFRGSLKAGFTAFRAGFVPIMVFEVIYRALTSLAAKPLLGFIMQLLLRLSGDELAFNDGIWRFALTPAGIVCIALLACLAVLLIWFEFAVVISLAKLSLLKEEGAIKSAVVRGLWSFKSLKSPGVPLFGLYALVLLPVVNMGVTSSLIPLLSVPNFITGELTKTPVGGWLLVALVVLVGLLFCGLLFVLPAMALERAPFGAAVRRSFGAIKAYHFKMLGVLLVFALAWLVLFLGPRQLFDFFFGATSVGFVEALSYYGLSLRAPFLALIWLAASFLQLALMPLLLTLLTAFYLPLAQLAEPGEETAEKISAVLDRITGWLQRILLWLGHKLQQGWRWLMARPFVQKHKKLLGVLAALVLVSMIANALMTTTGLHDPIVIGHRGSASGVENTLEAIQGAIDAGAGYAEVDILLSKDNVPMVVHDTNLSRLAGQDVNVWELTAEELGNIPLSSGNYTGTIPTLQQVVDYCEGKILLAVEYKLHGHEQTDVVDAAMQVIQKSAWQKHSLYLSLDFGLVSAMKARYPSYLVGYCVYGNVGQLEPAQLREMNIDFLLVEEWMVNSQLIKACRRAWLPVYVWTANDPQRMDDYLRLGVVGLVTDYPDDAMAVVGSMYSLEDMVKPHQWQ